jgi:hypothetical protein
MQPKKIRCWPCISGEQEEKTAPPFFCITSWIISTTKVTFFSVVGLPLSFGFRHLVLAPSAPSRPPLRSKKNLIDSSLSHSRCPPPAAASRASSACRRARGDRRRSSRRPPPVPSSPSPPVPQTCFQTNYPVCLRKEM